MSNLRVAYVTDLADATHRYPTAKHYGRGYFGGGYRYINADTNIDAFEFMRARSPANEWKDLCWFDDTEGWRSVIEYFSIQDIDGSSIGCAQRDIANGLYGVYRFTRRQKANYIGAYSFEDIVCAATFAKMLKLPIQVARFWENFSAVVCGGRIVSDILLTTHTRPINDESLEEVPLTCVGLSDEQLSDMEDDR